MLDALVLEMFMDQAAVVVSNPITVTVQVRAEKVKFDKVQIDGLTGMLHSGYPSFWAWTCHCVVGNIGLRQFK